jgi:hypothetical protein
VDFTLRRLDRRQALKGAGLLGTAALAALIPAGVAADDQAAGEGSIQGAWLVDVVPDVGTTAPHNVLITYAQGGTVVGSASDAPGTFVGAWSQTRGNQAAFTFEAFTFAQGIFAGTLRVRGLATHDRDTDTISGPAHIDFQPAGSPTFFPAGSTKFSGSRVSVLPL